MYIPRHIAPYIEQAAKQNPVIGIIGPRQTGKTTLAQKTFPCRENRPIRVASPLSCRVECGWYCQSALHRLALSRRLPTPLRD